MMTRIVVNINPCRANTLPFKATRQVARSDWTSRITSNYSMLCLFSSQTILIIIVPKLIMRDEPRAILQMLEGKKNTLEAFRVVNTKLDTIHKIFFKRFNQSLEDYDV